MRCHLHYLTGRAEERLTFDLQREIAAPHGLHRPAGKRGVERFMKHYFLVAKDVGDLTRIFCAALEEQQPSASRGSRLAALGRSRAAQARRLSPSTGERLDVADDRRLQARPGRPDPRCSTSPQEHDLDIHPTALRLVTQIAAPDRSATAQRSRGEPPVPGDPDLAQGPGDDAAAHERGRRVRPLHPRFRPRRRADAVRHVPRLHGRRAHASARSASCTQIESGTLKDDHPLATDDDARASCRGRVLYLAMLLHDIAKGRGGDHSRAGRRGRAAARPAARAVAPRRPRQSPGWCATTC